MPKAKPKPRAKTPTNPNGAGRPTKLNHAMVERMLAALRSGSYRGTAARWSGIGERTFYDWMTQGKARPESEYGKFRRSVIDAEESAEIDVVRRVHRNGDPSVLLKFLSIRWRKRWNPKQEMKIVGDATQPLAIHHTHEPVRPDLSSFTEEEIDTWLALDEKLRAVAPKPPEENE